MSKSKRLSHVGFTLIEVLLALAIMSIALTALLLASSRAIQQSTALNEAIQANLVNQQIMRLITLKQVTRFSDVQTFSAFGKTWYWKAQASPTNIPEIERITISSGLKQSGPFSAPLTGFRQVYYE